MRLYGIFPSLSDFAPRIPKPYSSGIFTNRMVGDKEGISRPRLCFQLAVAMLSRGLCESSWPSGRAGAQGAKEQARDGNVSHWETRTGFHLNKAILVAFLSPAFQGARITWLWFAGEVGRQVRGNTELVSPNWEWRAGCHRA